MRPTNVRILPRAAGCRDRPARELRSNRSAPRHMPGPSARSTGTRENGRGIWVGYMLLSSNAVTGRHLSPTLQRAAMSHWRRVDDRRPRIGRCRAARPPGLLDWQTDATEFAGRAADVALPAGHSRARARMIQVDDVDVDTNIRRDMRDPPTGYQPHSAFAAPPLDLAGLHAFDTQG